MGVQGGRSGFLFTMFGSIGSIHCAVRMHDQDQTVKWKTWQGMTKLLAGICGVTDTPHPCLLRLFPLL